jgi:hypothetical protein
MAELTDLRARLRDRQKKAGALGTTETTLCLDLSLLDDLGALKEQRAEEWAPEGRVRLGAKAAETAELDALIEAKEAEIKAASIRVVFQAMSSSKYQEVLNAYPTANEDGEAYAAFLNAIASGSLFEVWENGQKIPDVTWDDIREGASYGEWDLATTKVLALNRRTVDLPFSLKPSKATRQPSET